MIGPEGAAQALTDQLAARLPGKLAELRDRLGVPALDLPNPGTIEPHDRIRRPIEAYPAVLVLLEELARFTPTDRTDTEGETWVARYPARTYLWCRGDDEIAVDLLRKRYVLAVREALLERRALAQVRQAEPGGLYLTAGDVPTVDPTTLRESYAPIALDENGATIAPAYVEAHILIAEQVPPPAQLGTATTITVDERPLAQHPAL